MKTPILKPLTLAIMATSLTGCFSSDSGGDSGTLSLGITDAPVDSLQEVNINYTGITLKPANGDRIEIDFDEPKQLDMLTLQGDNAASLLSEQEVAAGEYNWIRLDVDSSDVSKMNVVEDGGGQVALTVPSGELKLVSGFTVPAGGSADFTIDFDMRKAIIDPQGQQGYKLRPALRLIDNTEVGKVSGSVTGTLVSDACASPQDFDGSVYVYEGADATAVDYNPDASPLTSADVKYDSEQDSYSYTAAFLAAGDYTVAYTCTADDPEAEESLDFRGKQNVTVEADTTKTVDFEMSSE